MVNKLIRVIYKKYRHQFIDLMTEEFLADVPKNLTEQSVSFLAEKKSTIKKWLYWQAYWLQRRNVTDVKNSEKIQGSLMQIKVMLHLLDNSPTKEVHPTYGEVKPVQKLAEHIEGVDKFSKGLQ